MPSVDSNEIILALIFMDALIVIVFVLLLWKMKSINIEDALQDKMEVFESLLVDADRMSLHIKKNMEEKQLLLKQFDDKFEQRMARLNQLLEKAEEKMDVPSPSHPVSLDAADESQEGKIIQMVDQGMSLEDIAECLSIPRGKVKLVLDLKKIKPDNNFSR